MNEASVCSREHPVTLLCKQDDREAIIVTKPINILGCHPESPGRSARVVLFRSSNCFMDFFGLVCCSIQGHPEGFWYEAVLPLPTIAFNARIRLSTYRVVDE